MGETVEGQPKQLWPMIRPWAFLVTILVVAAFVLSRPAVMPRLAEDARADVLNDYRLAFEQRLVAERPELPEGELRIQSAAAAREYEHSQEFSEAAAQRAAEYRAAFSDETGKPRLLHNDPYNYLRQTENLERYGIVGTQREVYGASAIPRRIWSPEWLNYTEILAVVDTQPERIGRQRIVPMYQIMDQARSAPERTSVEPSLFPYALVLLHRMVGGNIRNAAYISPLLFGLLTVALLFCAIRLLSTDYGALLGTFFFAIHPAFFGTAEIGYADTNAFILLHMVAIALLTVLLLRSERFSAAACWAALLGAALWSFAFTWDGVLLMVAALLTYTGALAGALLWRTASVREQRQLVLWPALVLVGSLVLLFFRSSIVQRGLEYLGFSRGAVLPNPYLLIGELGKFSLPLFSQVLGGLPMLVIITAGLAYLVRRIVRRGSSVLTDLFLLCWLAVLAIPAFHIRFFVFFLLPLAVLVGMALGEYLKQLPAAVSARRQHKGGFLANATALRTVLCAALIAFTVLLFAPNLRAEINAAIPVLDKNIASTAAMVEGSAAPNALLNAWWDSGYFYTALADRATLTDGSFPNDMKAYWLAAVYLGADPALAVRMLQMLDCGGANALTGIPVADAAQAKGVVEQVLRANRVELDALLLQHSSDVPPDASPETDEQQNWRKSITQQFRCIPPEAYLILSEDLLKKLWVLEVYQESKLDGKLPSIRQRYALPPVECDRTGSTLRCGSSYVVNMRTWTAMDGGEKPLQLLTKPNGELLANGTADGAALMLYRESVTGAYYAMELKPEFFKTVLGQLYFAQNPFPAHFEPFSDFAGPYSGRVVTYRIVWPSATETTARAPER